MKTPSLYPVLDNRPIDQWKVAELKEELKRRKLTIKGLKDDLVRRLGEALREELESVKEDDDNDDSRASPKPEVQADEENLADTPQTVALSDDIGELSSTIQPTVQNEDIRVLDCTPQPVANADGKAEAVLYRETESMITYGNNAGSKGNIGCDSGKNEESVVLVTSVETKIVVNKVLPGEENFSDKEGAGGADIVKNDENLVNVTSVETSVTINEGVTHEVAMDVQELMEDDSKTQFEDQESEPPQDDVKLNSSDPSNQVSEVNTVLGFLLKSDSISSDSVSINEKNELKDNIIDDNVKLELDVKPEIVHPSSSNVISDGSEPCPMDVVELCDKKEPVDEGDEKNANLEMSKKNGSLNVGSSEKLNLDRSSDDDSMDDDTMENKPIDSKCNSDGVVDQGEKIEGTKIEEAPVVISDGIPADKKGAVDEMKKVTAAPIGKRKLNDQEALGNNATSKRQRRWNTGTLKVPEPQSNTASSTTPKDTFPTIGLKRRSDSTASEETPKERVVPPSPKSPTTSLKIDRFLRPFTLKAVQEFLGKTGRVTSFWMDHIKTHCYVTYSSVEEAVETRNAVYNMQWPPNGGRLLLAEFVDPQEVKTRVEAPPPPFPATPAAAMPPAPPATGQPPRQQRQQALPPPPPLPLPSLPPLSNPPQARERLPPSPPVEKTEDMDTPIVTLDDLFRKTKTTPRIYYLPLTDEQVAAKGRNIKQ